MIKTIFFLFCAIFFHQSLFSQNADITLLRQINLERNKGFDNTFKIITQSASPVSIGIPILFFIGSTAKKDKELQKKGLIIGSSIIISSGIATALKYAIGRDRPFVTYPDIEKLAAGGSPSFPSGHTSAAFSTAASLSLCFPKWYVIAPAFLWAGAVGYSRMHLGVHYPSDVLCGALIGAGSAYLSLKGSQWIKKKRNN